MLKKRLLPLVVAAAALPLAFAGCQSNDAATQKEMDDLSKKITREIKERHDPKFAVATIRKFAVESLNDITDAEEDFIMANEPEITSNFDNSMYAFVWKFEKHRMIEVLTSDAPFSPLAVYRVSRVYFP